MQRHVPGRLPIRTGPGAWTWLGPGCTKEPWPGHRSTHLPHRAATGAELVSQPRRQDAEPRTFAAHGPASSGVTPSWFAAAPHCDVRPTEPRTAGRACAR